MEGGGFEPPKAEPSDLQSDPFDHSGTPPKRKQRILLNKLTDVNSLTQIMLKIDIYTKSLENMIKKSLDFIVIERLFLQKQPLTLY